MQDRIDRPFFLTLAANLSPRSSACRPGFALWRQTPRNTPLGVEAFSRAGLAAGLLSFQLVDLGRTLGRGIFRGQGRPQRSLAERFVFLASMQILG